MVILIAWINIYYVKLFYIASVGGLGKKIFGDTACKSSTLLKGWV